MKKLNELLLNKNLKFMLLKKYHIVAVLIGMAILEGNSQNILGKQEAVEIALENNFDIRTADNNVAIARNNADIKNSGYLPAVSLNANATYTLTNTETVLHSGEHQTANGVNTTRLNGTVGFNYTIFDGLVRANAFRTLKENYNLSELQARNVIEASLLNIFNIYYEVARLTENVLNQQQTLDVSRERLLRATYSAEYGQNTQLDVLNAEVDYNNDSINYLTIAQQLANEKRNLNLLLGRDVTILFDVDTSLSYAENINFETLKANAELNNVNILQEMGSLRNAEYNLIMNKSASIPKIGLNANYGATYNDLGATSFADKQTLLGPSVGASLSWNIFDGGTTNIRKQNARISLENQKVSLEQTQLSLERDLSNAWTFYQTALFVLQAEKKNLETNQRNFDRTVEQYSLGQITNIVFRQAQINLLNAELNFNQAKYSAKVAELALYQISGDLLTADF